MMTSTGKPKGTKDEMSRSETADSRKQIEQATREVVKIHREALERLEKA